MTQVLGIQMDRVRKRLDHLFRGARYEHYQGHAWIIRGLPHGDDWDHPTRSTLRLFEDGVPLVFAHQANSAVAERGAGRYSHWGDLAFFSTTDNTDPNANGRSYTYDFNLDLETWERGRAARLAQLWKFHPRAEFFLARGGMEIPPPLSCNIGLTNKCNLRCEICGSQKNLDESGIRRRHMSYDTFSAVAETLFPILVTVELNSQGDPLLHPNIVDVLARIREHHCDIKLQTNGTLFSDRIISVLAEQSGIVMLSLDAVGAKFDDVRQGGVWAKAEPGLKNFFAERDPERLAVGIYPTLTKRTIGEALNVISWAVEHGADLVAFHRYVPIQNSWEEAPSEREYAVLREQLARWSDDNEHRIEIRFESDVINSKRFRERRTKFASPEKQALSAEHRPPTVPMERGRNSDPTYICTSPVSYVEIGLDGEMGACCRAQDVPLGHATSVERFAETWFGANYARLRKSLKRAHTGHYSLPNCEGCVKFFAPISGGSRKAVDYEKEAQSDDALSFDNPDIIKIEGISKERGHCFLARIPPGIDPSEYVFYEDDHRLSAHMSLHDDIRNLGGGRYAISGRSLYFSTSDGSDARRNRKLYDVRRVRKLPGEIKLGAVIHDSGYCFIAELPGGVDPKNTTLLENDVDLGPADSPHDIIRTEGSGRYSVWKNALYFSASDNSDPRANGWQYRLTRVKDSCSAGRTNTCYG